MLLGHKIVAKKLQYTNPCDSRGSKAINNRMQQREFQMEWKYIPIHRTRKLFRQIQKHTTNVKFYQNRGFER